MPIPRIPTPEEIRALSTLVEYDESDVQDMTYIAVFDHYVSEGPGYIGKVMLVVWTVGPSVYEVFTWNRQGDIQREIQDKWVSV